MDAVITATHLTKRYGDVTAVTDISLEVRNGEILGIVGPNGAGKTTTVEIIQGLRRPDGGTVRVLDMDPARDVAAVRQVVGTQLQHAVLPDRLKVWEALDLYACYYPQAADPDALLRDWDLDGKRNATFESLSGGQRQRLFIALALVGRPRIVVLDELTTGLDPQARRSTWDHIRAIRGGGVTVVLVTHFMDEAEALCDRIALIDAGRIRALDTPAGISRLAGGGQRVTFTAPVGFTPEWLRGIAGVEHVDHDGGVVAVTGSGPLLARVASTLASHDAAPDDLSVERTSLEDAYLALAGRAGDQSSNGAPTGAQHR